MTGDLGQVRPAPMEPGGAYNRSSGVQAAGLLPAVELLERSARAVELPRSPQPIFIADYGASAGHNSLLPIGAAIATLRTRVEPGRAISVFHTDVAENDYTALFHTLAGDPYSYLRDEPATFPCAVGRSFYQQILPSSSVTLGWSSWAVQWLSRVPALIPDHVQIAFSQAKAACAAYTRQASDDWIAFLTARSRELTPGGHLVVLTMALDDGEFGYRHLLSGLVAELEEMASEGELSEAEVDRMVIPAAARSETDLTAPFAPKNNFARLTIEELEIFDGEDKIWRNYEKSGDATVYGQEWTAFARAALFPTLATALDTGPQGSRADHFFDRLESGLGERLAAAPQPMRIPLAKMLLVKQSWPR